MAVNHHENLYMVREQHIERITSDSTTTKRNIISQTTLRLQLLMQKCCGKALVVYSANTDGIFIMNPVGIFQRKSEVEFTLDTIGKPYITDSKISYLI